MLDLSNNNGTHHDFKAAYQAGQRRLYVKVTEGNSFVDHTQKTLRLAAIEAGFKVGGYHFANDFHQSPKEQAHFFVSNLPRLDYRYHLAPCLDIEVGHPDAKLGVWAIQFLKEVEKETGRKPVIYSYASFLQLLEFKTVPAPLWLAAFGRNDGKEYPWYTPHPWKKIAAHQFSSNARVKGIRGRVDISHVYNFKDFDLRRLTLPL